MSRVNKIVDVTVTKNNKPYRGNISFLTDGNHRASRKTDSGGHATWRFICDGGDSCNVVVTVEADGISEDKHCCESSSDEIDFSLDI